MNCGRGTVAAREPVKNLSLEPPQPTNLEVVLFGFASHDDVEGLVGVLGAVLDAAGHVLLVLVGVQPHPVGPGVSPQLGLWIGA